MSQDIEEDLDVAAAAAVTAAAVSAEEQAAEGAAVEAAETSLIDYGQRDVDTAAARHSVDSAWLQLARYESESDTTCIRLRPRSWGGHRGIAGITK